MRRKIFFLTFLLPAIFLTAGVFSCPAQDKPDGEGRKPPVTVEASLDKDSITIGEKVKYTLRVLAKDETEIRFPDPGETVAGLTVEDSGFSRRTFLGKKEITRWYELSTFKTGEYEIPAIDVEYREGQRLAWNKVSAGPLKLTVRSLLDEYPEAKDIRDIKGPIYLRPVYPLVFLGLFILAAAAAAAIFVYKRRKALRDRLFRRRPRLPHEIAYEKLDELKSRGLVKRGMIRQYYFELSDIIRHYLEGRFNLRAPEMTTEEFLESLKKEDKLGKEEKSFLKEFLSHCDLVKFARYGASESDAGKSFSSARNLVDKTREEKKAEGEK